MDAALTLTVAGVLLVVLAVLFVSTTTARHDRAAALRGVREDQRHDRSEEGGDHVVTGRTPMSGRALERGVALERHGSHGAVEGAPTAPAPAPRAPTDPEVLGVTRRQFFNRSITAFFTQRAASYPHEFSGGMRQRVVIAMALVCEPDLLIADEPTTALDVTIQAQVIAVLGDIQDRTGAAILLITHDLGLVAGMADHVLVMYAGKAVEQGRAGDVFHRPRHPYTLGLLASLPRVDEVRSQRLRPIEGRPPSLVDLPPGCSFHPRCPFARLPAPCATEEPRIEGRTDVARGAACHFVEEVAAGRNTGCGGGSLR